VFLLSPHSLGLVDYFSSFFFNLLFGRFRILDRYLHRSSKSTTLLIMMRLLLLSTNRTNTRESDIIVDVVVVVFYSSKIVVVTFCTLFAVTTLFPVNPLCCCQPLCHCAVVIVPTAGCGTGTCLLPYMTLTHARLTTLRRLSSAQLTPGVDYLKCEMTPDRYHINHYLVPHHLLLLCGNQLGKRVDVICGWVRHSSAFFVL